jgi:hypothetical protein
VPVNRDELAVLHAVETWAQQYGSLEGHKWKGRTASMG